jgi:hypothetical protein
MDQTYGCSQVLDIAEEPRHHLVLANEFVRAFAVEIPPHDRTLCHRHPQDYLLYSASDAEIISAVRDEEPKRLSYRDGECELLSAGLVHVVDNIGDNPVRNVVVELLPRASELRRGRKPRNVDTVGIRYDGISSTSIFEDERAAIFLVKIKPGGEAGISGPAIVATPYGNKLTPDAISDVEVKNHPSCDLAWILPSGTWVLWGRWKQTERVIVFQIGRTDEQGLAVSDVRNPLRSLRAHAEPE